MRVEQTAALANFEQEHGRVLRVVDEHPLAAAILPQCLSGSRVYVCTACRLVVAIEPDGEVIDFVRA